MNKFDIKKFLSELNKNEFVRACSIPMGYKAGYPIIKKNGESVLLSIPYRKSKNTNQPQKFAVMPIEYLVTFELHAPVKVPEKLANVIKEEKLSVSATPAGFEILRNNEKFSDYPFDKSVGVFPHSAIENDGLDEYKEKVNRVYGAYDSIINEMLGVSKASGVRKLEFKQLLSDLVEPGLKHMYKVLDKDFFEKYLLD